MNKSHRSSWRSHLPATPLPTRVMSACVNIVRLATEKPYDAGRELVSDEQFFGLANAKQASGALVTPYRAGSPRQLPTIRIIRFGPANIRVISSRHSYLDRDPRRFPRAGERKNAWF